MAALTPHGGVFRRAGAGLVAYLPTCVLPGAAEETALFAGQDVVLAFRNGESAEAAAGWLAALTDSGITGALIYVRGAPEEAAAFAEALAAVALPEVTLLVVSADVPIGVRDGRDARHPGTAPAAPDTELAVPQDPWHAPLGEEAIFEALRHRFLQRAASVTTLDVGDYLLPGEVPLLARVGAASGEAIMLRGRETYAWSGGGSVADHVYVRRSETRWIVRWSVAPGGLPEEAVWRESGIAGVRTLLPPETFVRAMGQRYAGAAVAEIVTPGDLIEDREVSKAFERRFGRTPLRRPMATFDVPRRPVVVVSTMKNEGPYIVDWIAHHRAIGVDHFLIYTNDCSDETTGLLDALAADGCVTHRKNPFRELGGVPQRAAFRAAQKEEVVQSAAWLMPLDVDEFLAIHVGEGRLSDLFEAVPEASVISLPWRLFGNADIAEIEDRPVWEQFRLAAPDYAPRPMQAWGFKTLFRNDGAFGKIGVHAPRRLRDDRAQDVVWVDANGRPMPAAFWEDAWRMTPATWGYDLAQINHYAVRSAEAFLIKRERGRTNHTRQDQGLDYWFRMNFNGPEERSIDRYGAAHAGERARLMAVPGVAEAHSASVAWHRERAARLRDDPDYAALWAAITGSRMRALSRRLGHFGNNVFILGPDVVPDEIATRPEDGDWEFTVPLPERGKGGSAPGA